MTTTFYMWNYWKEDVVVALINQDIQQKPSAAGIGTTYYVSSAGIDTNNGTSLTRPVQTIKKGLSLATNSGDIVYVLTGVYVEAVYIGRSGITLSAYPGNTPIIDGQTTLPTRNWGALIEVQGAYNTISGFEVRNSNISGVYTGGLGVAVYGHHNTISGMNIHHTWEQGVTVQGDYNILQDSKIWQACLFNSTTLGSTGMWGMGVTVGPNSSAAAIKPGITSYPIIRRNEVYNNWGEGAALMVVDHGIMEDNISYDNWTVNLYFCNVTNSLMQRNIVYLSSNPAIAHKTTSRIGILLSDEVASRGNLLSTDNTIINNFVYNSDFKAFSWANYANSGLKNVLIANNTIVGGNLYTGYGNMPYSTFIVNTNSQIRNNIITGTGSAVPSNSGITFSNNNWGMTPPLAAAVTDIVGDPQIARTGTTTPGTLTSAYFKVLGSSPIINAAMPLTSVTEDFNKFPRGTAPDIGGYEFDINNPKVPVIDSIAPSVPAGLAATVNAAAINLVWSASTDNVGVVGYRIYKNGTELGVSATTSITDTAVVKGVSYSYTIKAYDVAGNISAASNTATIVIPLPVAVSITSSYLVNVANTSTATINWTTNIPATGVVSYGTQVNTLNLKVNASQKVITQAVPITGLVKGTTYYYNISVNSGQSTALSKTFSFKK